MSEPTTSAVPPPPTDISPLLAHLSRTPGPLSPSEASTTKAFLFQASQYPSELEKIVRTWIEGEGEGRDGEEGQDVLEEVLRDAAEREPEALIPLLLPLLSSLTTRTRSVPLLVHLSLSMGLSNLPLLYLLTLHSNLTTSLLLDTDPVLLNSLAGAIASLWTTVATHSGFAGWVEGHDEKGIGKEVGRMLAAVGRAMTWGWPVVTSAEGETDETVEEDEPKPIPLDSALELAPGITYERRELDGPRPAPPDLEPLLSVLYGLYPSQTLSFLRNPIEYLSQRSVECPFDAPWTEVLSASQIRRSAACLLSEYALNPSLLDPSLSPSSELTSPRRFESLPPSTLLARCLALRNSPALPPPTTIAPATTAEGTDETVVRKLKSELEWQTWVAQSALKAASVAQQAVEVHRAGESERQSLHIRLKELRTTLERFQKDNKKLREQAEAAKAQSSKWVESLQEKLKGMREEKRGWAVEAVELRSEVSDVQKALKAQGQLLAEAKQSLFILRAQRLEESPKVERMRNFERRIDQLTTAQKLWQEDVRKYIAQRKEMTRLLSDWETLTELLRAERGRASALEKRAGEAESRTSQLEAQLAAAEARAQVRGQLTPNALEYAAGLQKRVEELERELEAMRELRRRDLQRFEEQADLITQLQDSVPSDPTPDTSLVSPIDVRTPHTHTPLEEPSPVSAAPIPHLHELPPAEPRASLDSVRPTLGRAEAVPPLLTKVQTPSGIMARKLGEGEEQEAASRTRVDKAE